MAVPVGPFVHELFLTRKGDCVLHVPKKCSAHREGKFGAAPVIFAQHLSNFCLLPLRRNPLGAKDGLGNIRFGGLNGLSKARGQAPSQREPAPKGPDKGPAPSLAGRPWKARRLRTGGNESGRGTQYAAPYHRARSERASQVRQRGGLAAANSTPDYISWRVEVGGEGSATQGSFGLSSGFPRCTPQTTVCVNQSGHDYGRQHESAARRGFAAAVENSTDAAQANRQAQAA